MLKYIKTFVFFAFKTLPRRLSLFFFFAQAGEKQNTCVRIKIVVYLVNDEKIYTKQRDIPKLMHGSRYFPPEGGGDNFFSMGIRGWCHRPNFGVFTM